MKIMMELVKMNKIENIVRASIPGKINDLIWENEELLREITQNKKYAHAEVKFPRYDQYMEGDRLRMAFALAGYSSSDIKITSTDTELIVQSSDEVKTQDSEDDSSGKPKTTLQCGSIIRGIARRKFKIRFTLHSRFDPILAEATMKNGLLELTIPSKAERETIINIMEN
jgi:HSP20 family molecular chaperone IbpA